MQRRRHVVPPDRRCDIIDGKEHSRLHVSRDVVRRRTRTGEGTSIRLDKDGKVNIVSLGNANGIDDANEILS